jgi:signal peptide peptidase SppA
MNIENLTKLQAIVESPYSLWAVIPSYHQLFKSRLSARISGETPAISQPENEEEDYSYESIATNSVAVISVSGEIVKGTGLCEDECQELGICDLDNVSKALREANEDLTVDSVCLYFNTPGGETTGLEELCSLINVVSKNKLVIGFTDTLAASCGYILASQCSILFCSHSARVGSVGVIAERLDVTKEMEANGVSLTVVSAGKFKTEGHPATVMSDEEKTRLQTRVTEAWIKFKGIVTSKRTNISEENLEGQLFNGEEAVALNLADANCDSLDELLAVFAEAFGQPQPLIEESI